jgi:hypothetical protein
MGVRILRGREDARYETQARHLLCELPWWHVVVTRRAGLWASRSGRALAGRKHP